MFIDTHAHLYFDRFDEDRDAVIQHAFDSDVKKIINIAIDLDSARNCVRLAEQYDGLFAAVGVHPNDAQLFNDETRDELKRLLEHPKVVAVGEIGMDYYWDKTSPVLQETVFRKQIQLAKDVGLPIIIHNRNAARDILKILKSEGVAGLTGVFHCFSEDAAVANDVLALGFRISFTGNLTFKKSTLPAVAKDVPLDRLLLETDCPFLSPEPRRGRRNEPAHVIYIAEKLAEIKGLSLGEICDKTTDNAVKLFGLEG